MDNNNFGISEGAKTTNCQAMDENHNQNLHTIEGATVMAMREVLTELLVIPEEVEELGNETDPEMPELEPESQPSVYNDVNDNDDDLNDEYSDLFGSDTDGEELLKLLVLLRK